MFGNMILNINPLANNYLDWIPYVFAHEYHHCVWGNYWHVIKGGRTKSLIESMLIDGQANAFAKSFNPLLKSKWISQITIKEEKKLWNEHYLNLLHETNVDYVIYMFGDSEAGIPWCAGYFFEYRIIESFKKYYPLFSVKEIIEMSSEEIYAKSNYHCN